MSNPYFFIFFIMTFFVASLQGYESVWAQTTKLTPAKTESVPSESSGADAKKVNKKTSGIKNSNSSLKSAAQKKLQVDLSTVPDLGSAQTEAGVGSYAPGISNYVSPLSVVPASGVTSTYKSSDQFGNSSTNMLSSIGGVMNIFGMAQTVGQRINPRAGVGPMFVNECKDCMNAEVAGANATLAGGAPMGGSGDQLEGHDVNAILSIVKKETLVPFDGVARAEAQSYVNAIVSTLSPFGSLVLSNLDEYKQMCPTFENLNPNQRKAFMVFLYSAIFKQTSNYDVTKNSNVTVNGKSSNRVGMCQIEFAETKQIYSDYSLGLIPEESEFNTKFATDPLKNITICTARIFKATENQSAAGARPLKAMFPTVNFDQVGATLKNLNMCRGI